MQEGILPYKYKWWGCAWASRAPGKLILYPFEHGAKWVIWMKIRELGFMHFWYMYGKTRLGVAGVNNIVR